MEKGDRVYFCDVVPSCSIYEILELTIRTVADGWYVGVDEKTKQAHLFGADMIDEYVFKNRSDALEALKVLRSKGEKDD